VLRSAATDAIIESMKTLTVRPPPVRSRHAAGRRVAVSRELQGLAATGSAAVAAEPPPVPGRLARAGVRRRAPRRALGRSAAWLACVRAQVAGGACCSYVTSSHITPRRAAAGGRGAGEAD
jgi:hypothetical protein